MRKIFVHLDFRARDRIESLWKNGHSQKEIGEVLGVHKSTVSREIRKRKKEDGTYSGAVAEHKAGIERSNSKYHAKCAKPSFAHRFAHLSSFAHLCTFASFAHLHTVIVSGDGDFACLVDFLQKKNKLNAIIVPDEHKYSALLKKFSSPNNNVIYFINRSRRILEKS